MNRITGPVLLGGALLASSAALYLFQWATFHRTADTEFYLLQDLAFLPVQVLLVTLIVGGLLARRTRQLRMDKMNMVIGAFFAEVGTDLLRRLQTFDVKAGALGTGFAIRADWASRQYASARALSRRHTPQIAVPKDGLDQLRQYLVAKRDFLLRLLENPNLLEHDTFTDSLWAIFHLTEELAHRKDLNTLPDTDVRHLVGDLERAYRYVTLDWLSYMKHLQRAYPYLFSLALRTNPFDPAARVEIR